MKDIKIDQTLKKAIEAHKAADIEEAKRLYSAILRLDPNNADANHNMGIIAVNKNKIELGIPFFKKALEVDPNIVQFWLSLIESLIALNEVHEAQRFMNLAEKKGIKNNGLDELSKRLKTLSNIPQVMNNNNLSISKLQDPPQNELEPLIALYNQGKFKKLLNEISNLFGAFPQSILLHNINGAANSALGNYNEAVANYSHAINLNPEYSEAYFNRGNAFNNLGKCQEASQDYWEAVKIKPNYPDAYFNLGNIFYSNGQFQDAIKYYQSAIKFRFNYTEAYFNLGNSFYNEEKLQAAIENYQKVIKLKPDHAEAFNNMGTIFNDRGQFEVAIKNYEQAIKINPTFSDAYNNIGVALNAKGEPEAALKNFEKAIDISPNFVEAYLNGFDLLEKSNKIDKLNLWLSEFKEKFPQPPEDIKLYQMLSLLRKKDFLKVESIANSISIEKVSKNRQKSVLEIKGKIADRLNKFDKAYKHYCNMNQLIKTEHSFAACNPNDYFIREKKILSELKNTKPEKFNSIELIDNQPTFLIGFPRSGTTLLDTILRSHSSIDIVEEQDAVNRTQILLENFEHAEAFNFLDKFPNEKNRQVALNTYIKVFEQNLTKGQHCAVNIDKFPLNILRLPLINFLFPRTKYILVIRHPFDTILSNWMQNYQLNSAMANMVDLDRIVEFYCLTMETAKIAKEKLNLDIHLTRYEDLVADIELETTKILSFLNLRWENNLKDYRQTALKRKTIRTPSYSQVIEPLYNHSCNRWKNYEKYLCRFIPNIKPWVKEFGYDEFV